MPEVLQQVSQRKKGEKPLTNVQWRQVCGEKGVPWKDLEDDVKITFCTWDVGILFLEKARVKRFRELTDEGKQAGIQGQWQLESPARENLEQVKCCHDTDCTERMMKKVFASLKGGDWEEF